MTAQGTRVDRVMLCARPLPSPGFQMNVSSPLPTSDGDRSAQRLRVDCLAAFQIGEQQSGGGELTDQL